MHSIYVVVQFYPWFKFYFPLFLDMVMCGNEFETKENQNETKDKIDHNIYTGICVWHVIYLAGLTSRLIDAK